MNNWPIIRTYLGLAIRRQTTFKASLFSELIWATGYTLATLAFWQVLLQRFDNVLNWSFASIAVFMACVELFWGCSRGLFAASRYIWILINTGMIEPYLCRPFDTRLGILLRYTEPVVMLRSVILASVWAALAINQGWTPHLNNVAAALLILLLNSLVFLELSLTLNYLAFTWSKADAINEMLGGMYEVLKYPADIYSRAISLILTFCIPAVGIATWPAKIAIGQQDLWTPLIISLLLLVIWHHLQQRAWIHGLRRYEGAGG